MSREALTFPPSSRSFLEPHLPPNNDNGSSKPNLPFTTLTFATSLDSSLALAPGTRTTLSGPQSKAMTHYLRSRHDAILIGVGTAVADNPGLNCRIEGVGGYGGEGLTGQPRPIVIDPQARWDFTEGSKILELVREGKGRAPFIVTSNDTIPSAAKRALLESYGGKFIPLALFVGQQGERRLDWTAVLECLKIEGLGSVMIEGGGTVINSLLEPGWAHLVDSVIVTIAPTWLGQGGVVVSPRRRVEGGEAVAAARLRDVRWYPFGEDVVLCGKV
ncbi:dihydrofolate reductase-like domain-containing protein [Aspergillus bertholletiae]|uniref:2,5-diamino-6-ribosylamino-4(3H)-pyrimidinone 5'-phosphate reductase n=1 Tax=Aspergillus bertholletiae TaxID=1226010 RepID=A0A5N7AR45_9EURO|nr:dihydrofolate reductase-like domain-containing protein [Aspergillus bertholletiae]